MFVKTWFAHKDETESLEAAADWLSGRVGSGGGARRGNLEEKHDPTTSNTQKQKNEGYRGGCPTTAGQQTCSPDCGQSQRTHVIRACSQGLPPG